MWWAHIFLLPWSTNYFRCVSQNTLGGLTEEVFLSAAIISTTRPGNWSFGYSKAKTFSALTAKQSFAAPPRITMRL